MKRLIEQRYVVRQNSLTIIGLGLCVYFSWHILMGERSIFRLAEVNHQIAQVSDDYDHVHAKREQLQARVAKLRPGSIDPDLLEERARLVLGYAKPDEHVVILPN